LHSGESRRPFFPGSDPIGFVALNAGARRSSLVLPCTIVAVASVSRIIRKLRSFLRYSRSEQAWFLAAWPLLGLSCLAIRALSFRRIAPCLGHRDGCPWLPLMDSRTEARAARIGRSVRLAARYTPWESNCFPQAITARLLLGFLGIPYALFLGVARSSIDGPGMQAHAWVTAGRVSVTGGHSFDRFTVVGCFVALR
jgi:hypothetical protein